MCTLQSHTCTEAFTTQKTSWCHCEQHVSHPNKNVKGKNISFNIVGKCLGNIFEKMGVLPMRMELAFAV